MKEFIENLLGRLEELRDRYQDKYGFCSDNVDYGKTIGLNDAISIVNQLAEEYNNGWIPCSKRLPNEQEMIEMYCRNAYGSEFIVMIEGADKPTTLYRTWDGFWMDDNGNSYKVLAWQQLPEPYSLKEGDTE